MIDWGNLNISKADHKLIASIADRTVKLSEVDLTTIEMDLTAVHSFEPLNLKKLLDSPNGNFLHDMAGINRHIDRETGELLRCFEPQCGRRK